MKKTVMEENVVFFVYRGCRGQGNYHDELRGVLHAGVPLSESTQVENKSPI